MTKLLVAFIGLAFVLKGQDVHPERINWAYYEMASPLLRSVLQDFEKQGLKPLRDRTTRHEFGNVFTVAIFPVAGGREESGVFAILTIFVKMPPPNRPVLVQVIRLDLEHSRVSTSVSGRPAELGDRGELYFGQRVLALTLYAEGGVVQDQNRLVFEEVGRTVTTDCLKYLMDAAEAECKKRRTLPAESTLCRVSGWLWAKRTCWRLR